MPDLQTYTILIIDDEFLARKLLTEYVSKVPALKLAGTCSNAFEALEILQKVPVDIVLSDIQMPDLTGLELVRMLKERPAVIFTTAYSEHALESYDLDAVDYILKPIAFPRFFQAINKAIETVKRYSIASPTSVIAFPQPDEPTVMAKDFLMVKADYKIYKINFHQLLSVEGQGEYVTFHLTNRKITAYYSLKKLEDELPAHLFVRVHKSFIIALDAIESIEGNLLSIAGQKIAIGKIYKDELIRRLKIE